MGEACEPEGPVSLCRAPVLDSVLCMAVPQHTSCVLTGCLAWQGASTARCMAKQAALCFALIAGCALEQALQAARGLPCILCPPLAVHAGLQHSSLCCRYTSSTAAAAHNFYSPDLPYPSQKPAQQALLTSPQRPARPHLCTQGF